MVIFNFKSRLVNSPTRVFITVKISIKLNLKKKKKNIFNLQILFEGYNKTNTSVVYRIV